MTERMLECVVVYQLSVSVAVVIRVYLAAKKKTEWSIVV